MDRKQAMDLWHEVARGAPDDTVSSRMVELFANRVAEIERERCARLCEGLAVSHWEEYKRSGGLVAGNSHTEGLSDGADECALAIRGA